MQTNTLIYNNRKTYYEFYYKILENLKDEEIELKTIPLSLKQRNQLIKTFNEFSKNNQNNNLINVSNDKKVLLGIFYAIFENYNTLNLEVENFKEYMMNYFYNEIKKIEFININKEMYKLKTIKNDTELLEEGLEELIINKTTNKLENDIKKIEDNLSFEEKELMELEEEIDKELEDFLFN